MSVNERDRGGEIELEREREGGGRGGGREMRKRENKENVWAACAPKNLQLFVLQMS